MTEKRTLHQMWEDAKAVLLSEGEVSAPILALMESMFVGGASSAIILLREGSTREEILAETGEWVDELSIRHMDQFKQ